MANSRTLLQSNALISPTLCCFHENWIFIDVGTFEQPESSFSMALSLDLGAPSNWCVLILWLGSSPMRHSSVMAARTSWRFLWSWLLSLIGAIYV